MSLKTLTKLALGSAIGSIGLITVNAPAQAALIGDTVRGQILLSNGASFDQTAVVVDPGIEFSGFGGVTNIDVKNDSFDIIYDLTGLAGTSVLTT